MKNIGTEYSCCVCENQTTTLHELYFGKHYRPLCIEYSIQVPICYLCHASAHDKPIRNALPFDRYGQKKCREVFGEILDIDLDLVFQALQPRADRKYLEEIQQRCENVILMYASMEMADENIFSF
jgi:hypothetical protein